MFEDVQTVAIKKDAGRLVAREGAVFERVPQAAHDMGELAGPFVAVFLDHMLVGPETVGLGAVR